MATANLALAKPVAEHQDAPFYRPDESDRIERARAWVRVARGETANVQEPSEDKGR